MKLRLYFMLIASVIVGLTPMRAFALRAMPDDLLSVATAITIKRPGNIANSGSGFYLNAYNSVWLVTAKHVLWPDKSQFRFNPAYRKLADMQMEVISYTKDTPLPKQIRLSIDLGKLQEAGNIRAQETEDIVVIKVGDLRDFTAEEMAQTKTDYQPQTSPSSQPQGSGPPQKLQKVDYVPNVTMNREDNNRTLVSAGLENIKKFEDVMVGNDAYIYGFPLSLGVPEEPQFDYIRPLLRKGLVAGQDFGRKVIVLDCPVYRGNSGGPIFQVEPMGLGHAYYLIGIVSEFVPLLERTPDLQILLNSGYSIGKPMDLVLELI